MTRPANPSSARFRAELAAWSARGEDWIAREEQDLLLALCERHADRLMAAGDPSWPELYLEAEEARLARQGAGSGAEGLVLMSYVYQVRAARARRHESLGGRAHRAAALDVWQSIADDPNGTGRFAEPEVRRLRWIRHGVPAVLLTGGAPAAAIRIGAVLGGVYFLPVLLDGSQPLRTRSLAAFFPVLAVIMGVEAVWPVSRGRRRGPDSADDYRGK